MRQHPAQKAIVAKTSLPSPGHTCRYQFEQQKARENEADLDRMTAKPAGRRHDAYTDYLQRIAAGDTKTSWEAVQVCGR